MLVEFYNNFHPQGKIALEIIKDLHVYVGELIREFSNHNPSLPNKLVFYRPGVDDGSFEKVLDNELRAIQRAHQGSFTLFLCRVYDDGILSFRVLWS
jgi:hypothetical protein